MGTFNFAMSGEIICEDLK